MSWENIIKAEAGPNIERKKKLFDTKNITYPISAQIKKWNFNKDQLNIP